MTKPSPWAIGTTQTSSFVPRRGTTAVPRAFHLECTFKKFPVTKKVQHTRNIFKRSLLFSIWSEKAKLYYSRGYRVCVPMPAQACYDVTVFTCSVCEPSEATPSIPHLSLYLSPAKGRPHTVECLLPFKLHYYLLLHYSPRPLLPGVYIG